MADKSWIVKQAIRQSGVGEKKSFSRGDVETIIDHLLMRMASFDRFLKILVPVVVAVFLLLWVVVWAFSTFLGVSVARIVFIAVISLILFFPIKRWLRR